MDLHCNATAAPGRAAPMRLPSVDPVRPPSLAAAGAAHARIDRHPETAPPADEAGGDQENTKADSASCAERTALEQADKAFATLRARLALGGFEVHAVHGDDGGTAYLVHHWNLHRVLPDLAAVERFADRAGVRHG